MEEERNRKEEEERIKKLEDLDNFLGGITGQPKAEPESGANDDVLSVKAMSRKSKVASRKSVSPKKLGNTLR